MKKLNSSISRPLITAAYLMPAITCLILLIWACIPHLYFLYNGAAHETMSLFRLMSNTWTQSQSLLNKTGSVLADELFFAYIMSATVAVSWICIIWHALVAIPTSVCSMYAFSKDPTDKRSNIAKRLMHFTCPNRTCYVIFNLLPLLPAALPYILTYFYKRNLRLNITVCSFGPADFILSAILVTLTLASYLLLLQAQSDEHLDMFRLYIAK